LEDRDVDGKIIIQWVLRKKIVEMGSYTGGKAAEREANYYLNLVSSLRTRGGLTSLPPYIFRRGTSLSTRKTF